MKNPGLVGELAMELWQLREERPSLRSIQATEWSRRLAIAIAADVSGKPHYDPEDDARVEWVREILACRRRGADEARASGRSEATCAFLLGVLDLNDGNREADPDDVEVMFPMAPVVAIPGRMPVRIGKDLAAGD